MEARALVVALAPPDVDAQLAPYAEVLRAEGFTVASLGPSGRGLLGGTWEPAPEVYYFCDLAVEEGNTLAVLHRLRPGEWPMRLFYWMRLETPEELRWLLQRSHRLCQARANTAAEAAIHAPLLARPGDSAGPS
jgi:hypothetical protein